MTTKTIEQIRPFCDRYGDKLIELMDACQVNDLLSVPEDEALLYLEQLRRKKEDIYD